jgi:hypothetical protein
MGLVVERTVAGTAGAGKGRRVELRLPAEAGWRDGEGGVDDSARRLARRSSLRLGRPKQRVDQPSLFVRDVANDYFSDP